MPDETESRYDEDEALGRLLRERLPRYPAPPALRVAVVDAITPAPRRQRDWLWVTPSLAGMAAAMVLILAVTLNLPTSMPADPIQQITRAVVTEHARTLTWADDGSDVIPSALPHAMEESGVTVNRLFAGDEDLQLTSAQPTFVEQRRAISVGYRDRDGHAVTYVVMPAGNLPLPDQGRVQIDRWRPLVRRENGFSVILWKERSLLCALVADLVSEDDLGRLKQYFVKIRSSTELLQTY